MGSNAPSCDRRQRPFGPRGACALVQTACSCRAGRNCVRTFRGFHGARHVCMVDSQRTTPGRRPGPGDMTKSRGRRFCDARLRSNVLATPGVAASGSSGGPIRREKAGSRHRSSGFHAKEFRRQKKDFVCHPGRSWCRSEYFDPAVSIRPFFCTFHCRGAPAIAGIPPPPCHCIQT